MKNLFAGLFGLCLLFAAAGCSGTVATVNIGSRWGYQNTSETSVYRVTAARPDESSWTLNYYPTGEGTLTTAIEGMTLAEASAECPDPSVFEGITADTILKVTQETDFEGQFCYTSDNSALGDPFTYDISVTSYCLTTAKSFQTLHTVREMKVAYVSNEWEVVPYSFTVSTAYKDGKVTCKIEMADEEQAGIFPALEGEAEVRYDNSFYFDNDSIYYAVRSISELAESYSLTYQTYDYNSQAVKSVSLSMAATSSESSSSYLHEVNISGMNVNGVTVPENTNARCLEVQLRLSGSNSGSPLSLFYCVGGEDDPYESVHFAGAGSATSYRKLVRMEQSNFTYVMTSFTNNSDKAN